MKPLPIISRFFVSSLLILITKLVICQTYIIDSTFTQDAVLHPFGPNDTLYSLKMSGTITLDSNNSLVRVIVGNEDSLEYMIYEGYPLITTSSQFSVNGESDETTFLNTYLPKYLKVQLKYSSIDIDSLFNNETIQDNLDSLQSDGKTTRDLQKIHIMNQRISEFGLDYIAGENELLALFYNSKKHAFGKDKYNLQGYDFYVNGVFSIIDGNYLTNTNSGFIKEFDWREVHNSNDPNSYYYDPVNGWLTYVQPQLDCGACAAFGTISSVEALINLYYNQHINFDLSQQELFCCAGGDCDDGLDLVTALNTIKNRDIPDENCYIYVQEDDLCCFDYCPDFTEQYNASIVSYNSPGVGLWLKVDSVKSKLIRKGPLTARIENDDMDHVMSLIGYRTDLVTNEIEWIFKDSYLSNDGFRKMKMESDWFEELYHIQSEFETYVVGGPQHSVDFFDKDNDGYYNWGIGEKPVIPEECYSDLFADSNDDDKTTGPYNEYFYGTPIKPEIAVYRDNFGKEYVTNNGYLFFDNQNITLNFCIENPGSAQLNLNVTDPISICYPCNFDLDILNNDNSICMKHDMDVGTKYFNINFATSGTDPEVTSVYIDIKDADNDVIDDFEFILAYYDCQKTSGIYEPIDGEIWNDRIITQDVHIPLQYTLTVTGNVAIAKGVNIFVDEGAELIIDGGILQGSCGYFWNGIDVWGDNEYSQFGTKQGKVRVINGGAIKHAICGIETAKEIAEGGNDPSGGIVQCQDGFFEDNIISVKLYPYQNFNPQTLEPENNLCRFKNTEFRITQELYNMEIEENVFAEPDALVDLQIVEGILFKGNTFKNIAVTTDESRGIGIRAGTAGFYVYNECAVPNTIPCPDYYLTNFEHLDYGILVLGDRESLPIVIDSATFTDNLRGILMSGVNNAEIFHNIFKMDVSDSYHSTVDTLIGVYLEACQEFLLTENNFKGYLGTQMKHAAIYAHNLGPYYNEIYNNTIENLSCGIIAAGENRDGEEGNENVGLCIKCNDFSNCQYDVYVTPYGGIDEDRFGIALSQGQLGSLAPPGVDPDAMAAGNRFTSTSYSDLQSQFHNHTDLDLITYFHHPDPSGLNLEPQVFNNIYPNEDEEVEYSKEESCPSVLYENIDTQAANNTLDSEAAIVDLYQDTLNLFIDGGNTNNLNFDIQTSFPDEALQLRQQLLNDSPYLSDTVMNSAINKENVLPNAMVRDILVANPQSAKSSNVLGTIDTRFDPMPDYMMAEIMNGLNITGHKESLEKNKGFHISNRQKTISKLIRYYKNDTINSWTNDSLLGLLSNENNPGTKYRLSLLQLQLNDSIGANNTLINIPNTFILNTEEQAEYQKFCDLFDIISDLKFSNPILDSMQIVDLQDISMNSNELAYVYAKNILVNHGIEKYNEEIFLPENLKSAPVWEYSKNTSSNYTSLLSVFPNPSKNYFIIEYDIRDNTGNAIIKIFDISGKPFTSIYLKDKQNQRVQPTKDWPSGIYIIQIFINGELKESRKLSLIK